MKSKVEVKVEKLKSWSWKLKVEKLKPKVEVKKVEKLKSKLKSWKVEVESWKLKSWSQTKVIKAKNQRFIVPNKVIKGEEAKSQRQTKL